jgi:hypothetical protein
MHERIEVRFLAGRDEYAAWLYRPRGGDSQVPAVVLCTGLPAGATRGWTVSLVSTAGEFTCRRQLGAFCRSRRMLGEPGDGLVYRRDRV